MIQGPTEYKSDTLPTESLELKIKFIYGYIMAYLIPKLIRI